MTTYEVKFSITIPVEATRDEVEAFLRFELGEVAQLSGSSPFVNSDLHSCEVSGVYVS